MEYNFDEIIDRSGTYAVKLEAMPAGNEPDALSVWVADMDFACAEPILKALHERIDRRIFGYTQYNNSDLKDAVCSWFRRRYDWEVPAEHIVFSPGIVPALAFLLLALTEEGDGVIIQRPVYYPFTKKIESNGRRLVNSPLVNRDGHYEMDFADLEEKFARPDVKGMILCSPHNPVGRVWTPDELAQLLAIAKRYQKWIISDEIHMDLTRIGVTHTPLAKLAAATASDASDSDAEKLIITCTAPSKTFNLAGMQLSNIVIPDDAIRAKFTSIVEDQLSVGMASPFGLAATIAAYNESEAWLDQLRAYLDGNFQLVYDFLARELPLAKATVTQGTYLAWIDLRAYGLSAAELERVMQKEAKIAFDEGYIFGEEGAGFERINVATPRANVEEVLRRMKSALDKVQGL